MSNKFEIEEPGYPMDHESVPSTGVKRCLILVFGLGVALMTILLPMSFGDVEYYQIAFRKQKSTGKVDLSRVYTTGRYLIGPDYTFKPFPADAHFEHLQEIAIATDDKIEATVSCAFQYFLKPEDLNDLHQEYDLYYKPVVQSTANAVIKARSSSIKVMEFIRKRQSVENEIFKALVERLGGKCCRKDCKQYKCSPGCIPHSKCTKNDKGLFVEVRYFQLLDFDIHEDVKGLYLRQVTEREQEQKAKFELDEKVVRKETERLKNTILNEAAEIQQNSTAASTVIIAEAEAKALVTVEKARNTGLSKVFSALNITSETHKASYIYLSALRRQYLARINVNYGTLMARD